MSVLASVIRLNSRLFLNCLEGVTAERAIERANDRTNNLAFIGCHLVDSRHFLAGQLGLEHENPFEDRLRSVERIDQMESFPAVAEIASAWRAVAPLIEEAVASLGPGELRAPSKARFPVDDPTVAGMIVFLIQHESYHIGQMALLRKYLGYSAMKYV